MNDWSNANTEDVKTAIEVIKLLSTKSLSYSDALRILAYAKALIGDLQLVFNLSPEFLQVYSSE